MPGWPRSLALARTAIRSAPCARGIGDQRADFVEVAELAQLLVASAAGDRIARRARAGSATVAITKHAGAPLPSGKTAGGTPRS